MKAVWDQKKLEILLKDFYKISHLRVGIFSPNGDEIQGYPVPGCFYCSAIRDISQGLSACRECDRKAYQQALAGKEVYIYSCHAGLTEMIIPIYRDNILISHLMCGQFRSGETQENPSDELRTYWRTLGFDNDLMNSLYSQIPLLDRTLTKAYAHILQACAAYVWMDNYIRILEEPLGKRVTNYVTDHLNEKITIADLTDFLHVGKTTLCNTVKAELGMTVTELIRSIRMEEAKNLLLTSAMSISEIADQIGIDDYNYFTKVFKQNAGCTPSDYRKRGNK